LASCEREVRDFHPDAPFSEVVNFAKYERNAQVLSDGKRLYVALNCVGCHAHGGGGMGPALMDDRWLYGWQPRDIYESISHGRPNGMPAFGDKIPPYQTWQIVAYVRSMSGWCAGDAAPGRSDHMAGTPPENSVEKQTPVKDPDPAYGPRP